MSASSTSCARRWPSARASPTSRCSRCASQLMEWTKRLGMDDRFTERYLNEGFSGGEKKRNEILQMAMMEPDVAVLDETDSGLDIDALRAVADGHRRGPRATRPELGILLITHYQRILDHLTPDVVHVLLDGRIVADRRPRARRAASRPRASTRSRTRRQDAPSTSRARRRRASRPTSRSSSAQVNGKRLVYLDSASSSQKPHAVLDAMDDYYRDVLRQHPPRRLHDRRGGHRRVRGRARQGRRASSTPRHPHEIVFARNATEAINLVAYSWARANLARGRRHRAHAHGAPRQRRAVAHARRRARRRAALDPAHRRLPPRPHRPRRSCSTAPSSSRSPRCRTCSAPSTTSARSPTPPTPPARSCSSTRARPCRTSPSTCRRGTPTSSRSPRTRCAARPASARCGPAASCSRRCRRSSAAAR